MKYSCPCLLHLAAVCLCIILVHGASTKKADATTVPNSNATTGHTSDVHVTTGARNQTTQPVTAETTRQTTKHTAPVSIPSTAAPRSTTRTTPRTTTKNPERAFDGASFGGGFALAAGLVIIGAVIYKCYTRRSGRGYDKY